ncbi:PREDICTED: protein snail homolog Sna-like [Poecilia mexicana]|uniref:C2H2-type domain-containing protein n=1 Tax=Poecilia mexicana TaxID=48701 RepID=A0A3B3XIM9_9TELE|nr:PREDICTED: protein snail homolog Sna-like [Poecilia mexicana]
MPRSFLVKKYFAKQKPNYSELECQNDTSLETYPLAEVASADHSTSTCFTTGLVWDLSVLPALYLPTPHSEASGTSGPLDLSSPCSLSSSASSSGEEDEGRSSDPPSPEPVITYAPRQRMKCTGVMAHVSPPEEEEERGETPAMAARPAFLCKHCPKEYTSLGALKMHIRSHTLPCVCTTCGKAFSRPWLLRGHIRTHTGERPFSCPHCNRAFADRSNLRAHLQTHAEVKKYQCGVCSRTFSRMSLLQKHSSSGCCSTLG